MNSTRDDVTDGVVIIARTEKRITGERERGEETEIVIKRGYTVNKKFIIIISLTSILSIIK